MQATRHHKLIKYKTAQKNILCRVRLSARINRRVSDIRIIQSQKRTSTRENSECCHVSIAPRRYVIVTKQQGTCFAHLWICWSNFLLCSVHLVFSPPNPSISAVALPIFLLHASASSTSVCLSRMAWSYLACTRSNSRCFSSNCPWASFSSAVAFCKRASWIIRLAYRFEIHVSYI